MTDKEDGIIEGGGRKMVYKNEDSKTIYEYLNKKEKELNEELEFICALKRELVRGKQAEMKLDKIEKAKDDWKYRY